MQLELDSARVAVQTTADRLLNTPLVTISGTPITLTTVGVFLLILLATWWLSRVAQRGTRRALGRRPDADPATIAVSARLVHYAVLIIGLGIGLQTIGINLGALFAAGAFFAIALGFAMQNVAQNFVAGVILLTERTIKPGDVLQVEGSVVKVTHMGMRATVARSRDEEDLIIPNSLLVQNTVTNYTLRDSFFRVRATVGVAYESDLPLVMRILREAAVAIPGRAAEHEPLVLLTGFGESSVDFEVSIWVPDPWNARRMLSDLNEAIWATLARNGVRIPFPQRDVHVDPRQVDAS